MDWAGDDCSGVDCNIKDYIDAKSAPCTDNNSGECYITQATKSALDTDLAAGNIKSGTQIFGVTGNYSGPGCPSCPSSIMCRCGTRDTCWTNWCLVGSTCMTQCVDSSGYTITLCTDNYQGNNRDLRCESSNIGYVPAVECILQ